ncbi:hypothetical protein ZWY2020_027177 [Hordeum vulgare]|nr:hypothetical protein ZWY2020_027177 [Hordeum vulgare]
MTMTEMSGYLIYDARKDSLSVIPPIPSDEFMATGHQSALVMCDATAEGYLLAELVWVMPVPARQKFGLTIWTLHPDHSGWSISYKCSIADIWANANYQSAGLRQLAPSFPVLSIHEDSVVFLVS